MSMKYCSHCLKETEHKYLVGWVPFFAVLFTLGWWLLIISIYYRRRCVECGNRMEWQREYEEMEDVSTRAFESFMIFVVIVLVQSIIIFGILSSFN
ncbi:MAG: hypothetical protein NT072_02700 [Deltaproteobacteria bacterium]|nr:hypothetical protein [Deltaproteobacteria bacterium]